MSTLSYCNVIIMKYNKYTNQQLDSKVLSNAKLSIQQDEKNNMIIYLSSCMKNKNEYVLNEVNTKIYCASKKEGKLSITLPDYSTNLLINSADEDEIDDFVSIIANRYNKDNKENVSKQQEQQSYNYNNNNNNNNNNKETKALSTSSVFKLMCLGENKQSNHNSPTSKSKILNQEGNNRKKYNITTPEKQISTPPKKLNHQRYSPNAKNISSGVTPIKKKIKMNLTPTKFILSKSPNNSPIIKNKLKNNNLIECNPSIILTEEQNKVIDTCLNGISCFITGVAGTGKSMLLNHIVLELEKKSGKQSIFVTATTGLAACLIGGTTIHQFAGISGFSLDTFDDKEDVFDEIILNTLSKNNAVLRWRQVKTLLIDEISMLSPRLLDLLNEIAQKARGNNRPMGGLQVIFCGDFFQLPPVVKSSSFMSNETKKIENSMFGTQQNNTQLTQLELITSTQNKNLGIDNNNNNNNSKRFCFQSDVWKALIKKSFVLDKVFRQKHMKFVQLLDSIRKGNYSTDVENEFRECVGRRLDCNDGILPTHIYTHRNDVDKLNSKELNALQGTVQEYKSIDSGETAFIKMLQANCPAKQILKLKLGAQVILVKTIDIQQGLVNGARGVIVSYSKDSSRPIVRFTGGIEKIINCEKFTVSMGGKVLAQRIQIPLDLSWGISVHKSQGMTVDKAILNLRKCFEYGQAYVALSRVKSFEGLSLSYPLQEKLVKAHPSVKEFYASLEILK